MHGLKKIVRFLFLTTGVLLLTLVLFIAGALAFTQTSLFKSYLRDKINLIANENLHAVLDIGRIQGTFFTSLIVKDARLSFGDTTVVAFESLELSYDLWSLLDKKLDIHTIRLKKPYVHIWEDSTGVMNISRIAKPTEPRPGEAKEIDSLSTPLKGFQISLGELSVEDGIIRMNRPDMDYAMSALNMRMNLTADSQVQRLDLKQFAFRLTTGKYVSGKKTKKYDSLTCRNLSLSVSAHALPSSLFIEKRRTRPDTLFADIHHLRLTTDRTDMYVAGHVILPDTLHRIGLSYRTTLRLMPFHLDDARLFADIGIPDLKKIELDMNLSGNDTTAVIEQLSLATIGGNIRGKARVAFTPTRFLYLADLKFTALNAAVFTGQQDLSSRLSGTVLVRGEGTDIATMQSQVNFNLTASRFQSILIDQLNIETRIASGKASMTRLEGQTSVGNFNFSGSYHFASQEYELQSAFHRINIANAIGDTALHSNLNVQFTVHGKGMDPATMNNYTRIQADSSSILGYELDRFILETRMEKQELLIDQLRILTPIAAFDINGKIGMDSSVDLKYALRTVDIRKLKSYIANDTLFSDSLDLRMMYKGKLKGKPQNLAVDGQFTFNGIRFGDIRVDSVLFVYFLDGIRLQDFQPFSFLDVDSHLFGDVYLFIQRGDLGGSVLKDIKISITKESRKTLFEISGSEENMDAMASLKGNIVFKNPDKGRLWLDEFDLRVSGKNLKTKEISVRLGEDPIIDSTYVKWQEVWKNNQPVDIDFDIGNHTYQIRSFAMDLGKGVIAINGQINIQGDQNIEVSIKSLDISRANALIGSQQSVIEGKLNLNASLKGSFEKPIIIADWNITDGKVSEFIYDNFIGNLQYLNRKVQVNMTLNQNKDKTLTMGGYLPIDLTFTEVQERFINRPMKFKIHSEGIDLRFLQSFLGKNLTLNRGEIKIDLDIGGSRDKPVLKGEIKVEDGMMTFPRTTLGQNFRNMRMFVRIKPDSVFLDTLTLQSGKDPASNLFMQGYINLADLMKKFDFENTDKIGYEFQIAFNNFVPINTKSETSYLHTARLTGVMDISAKRLMHTMIKGDLQIRNAQIWVVDPARARSVSSVEDARTKKKFDDQAEEESFYKNLDLDLMISLPENSDNTIRSADMLLSLYGEIGVTKPPGSEDFFISGDVNTKKGGKYTYLNAAFNIENGVIVFAGEPGINPSLNILAVKRFEYKDDDGTPIPGEARIQVTGTLLKPEIAITAVERGTDDPLPGLTEPIDILSYLALGVKTSQLTRLGADQAGDFAKQVAINQILNAVANKAGLQKLEFSSGNAGQGATIAVSKRISEALSISYQGGIGGGAGRTVTLEISADSLMRKLPALRSWKKTVELEYVSPDQESSTQKEDIINFIFYFRKDY